MTNRYSSFTFGISRVIAFIHGSYSFEIQGHRSYFIKKLLLPFLLAILLCLSSKTDAQEYEALDYYYNATFTYGVKIKTNIPFQNLSCMPVLHIEGYNYTSGEPIGLTLVWYVYNNDFIYYGISSWAAYTPPVYLCNENGMITIFIDVSLEKTASFAGHFACKGNAGRRSCRGGSTDSVTSEDRRTDIVPDYRA